MFNITQKLVFFVLIIMVSGCNSKTNDTIKAQPTLIERLSELDVVDNIESMDTPAGFLNAYKISFSQPLDHAEASSWIYQNGYLYVRDINAPNLIETSGYGLSPKVHELSNILQANLLVIEHRLYDDTQITLTHLPFFNLRQSAHDTHSVISSLQPIFKRPWVSTGNSKGGLTSLAHRYLYPEDVSGTVNYVTPLLNGLFDSRITDYMMQVSSSRCPHSLELVQRKILENRQEMVNRIGVYFNELGLDPALELEQILNFSVLELPFQFWQWGSDDCESLVSSIESNQALFDFLRQNVPLALYSVRYIGDLQKYYIQAAMELGEYPYALDHLLDLLPDHQNLNFLALLPSEINETYNGSFLQEIKNWVEYGAEDLIFIYGKLDPWTGAAVDSSFNPELISILVDDANHSVSLQDLDSETKQQVTTRLLSWVQ